MVGDSGMALKDGTGAIDGVIRVGAMGVTGGKRMLDLKRWVEVHAVDKCGTPEVYPAGNQLWFLCVRCNVTCSADDVAAGNPVDRKECKEHA